jgi:DNA-binding transcriptional LysR family regulator
VERWLNPRQLQAFRSLMQEGTVTAAAGRIGRSQPAVSRLVAEFEAELGLVLFERRGRALVPNEAARLLLHEVERHQASAERLRDAARGLREFRAGRLHVAAMPALTAGFLAPVMRQFLATRPDVSVVVDSASSAEICQAVAARHTDLGLATPPGTLPGVVATPMPATDILCACPSDHPVARKREVRPADLQGVDFVLLGGTSPLRQAIEAMFVTNSVRPRVRLEVLYSATALAYVAEGIGVGLVDAFAAYAPRPGVTLRRFAPTIRFHFAALTPEHSVSAALAAVFAQHLDTAVRQVGRMPR